MRVLRLLQTRPQRREFKATPRLPAKTPVVEPKELSLEEKRATVAKAFRNEGEENFLRLLEERGLDLEDYREYTTYGTILEFVVATLKKEDVTIARKVGQVMDHLGFSREDMRAVFGREHDHLITGAQAADGIEEIVREKLESS